VKQIQFKNTSISYSDTGKGTAIVLLHGFLENQSMWDHYIPTFPKEQSHHIYWVMEKQNVWAMHTMEDNADAVYSVLSELSIRKSIRRPFYGWLCVALLSPNCTL
jgi:pimeloyl-ACP methyl ester carboxylesterase